MHKGVERLRSRCCSQISQALITQSQYLFKRLMPVGSSSGALWGSQTLLRCGVLVEMMLADPSACFYDLCAAAARQPVYARLQASDNSAGPLHWFSREEVKIKSL